MSSKISSVIVLMPNGRRQTLKVNLDSSVLQILEDVCEKHGFDSNEFALKHHSNVLDPASVVRFCGLPNNAFLEMVPNRRQTLDPSSKVILSLQVDGESERLTDEFTSDANLEFVLSSLYPKVLADDTNKVLVVVYMRREIVGLEALKTTTLRSLGLTSGRALLRLTVRDSEEHPELRCSGVSVLSKPKPPSPRQSESASQLYTEKTRLSTVSCNVSSARPTFSSQTIPAAEIVTAVEIVDDVIGFARTSNVEESTIKKMENVAGSSKEKPFIENAQISSKAKVRKDIKNESSRKTPSPTPMDVDAPVAKSCRPKIALDDIKFLDENRGLVFQIEDSCASFSDVPDSFFDITIEDLKLMMRDLKRNRESMENRPLQTEALRQLEMQNKTRLYNKTVVRVQFPDKYVLQGVFNPDDRVAEVGNFVKRYLREPNYEFILYTSPPKNVLPLDETLLKVGCVPCAKMYFAYVDQNPDDSSCNLFLNDKVLSSVTSQLIASVAAGQIRGMTDDIRDTKVNDNAVAAAAGNSNATNIKKEHVKNRNESAAASSSAVVNSPSSSSQLSENKSPTSSQQGKVPKWFKPV